MTRRQRLNFKIALDGDDLKTINDLRQRIGDDTGIDNISRNQAVEWIIRSYLREQTADLK